VRDGGEISRYGFVSSTRVSTVAKIEEDLEKALWRLKCQLDKWFDFVPTSVEDLTLESI
jgi:hypothetical protein